MFRVVNTEMSDSTSGHVYEIFRRSPKYDINQLIVYVMLPFNLRRM